jgi:hypothetical protein
MSDEGGKRDKTELGDSGSDDSYFSQSIGIRRLIQNDVGLDRLLLAYNGLFLPCVSIVLWAIFLVVR